MTRTEHVKLWAIASCLLLHAAAGLAQAPAPDDADDPFGGEDAAGTDDEAEDTGDEPAGTASGSMSAGISGTEASVTLDAATQPVDSPISTGAPAPELILSTGSHIRRPRLLVDGAPIMDTPLRTDSYSREYLQARRGWGGIAVPDTAAALKIGGPGTARFVDPFGQWGVRQQPTLVLLNGRRLVASPFIGLDGVDTIDTNQVPLQLLDRVEITAGNAMGLYGADAIGGVANFITRRKFEGLEIEIGGQSTDKFDQMEGDITATTGFGDERTGMSLMVHYLNRRPLAARDRDWILDRTDRVESLLGSPATFQQLTNFEYPIADPYCNIAQQAGHSTGYEVRLRGYGPPNNIAQLTEEQQMRFLNNHDRARGNSNGIIEALETSTFCAVDYTGSNDLVLKDERFQTYSTFWHKLSDHTEAFGELGYYRSDNVNRTAPAFPISRLTPDINNITPVWVPPGHADQPVDEFGFAAVEVPVGRIPNYLFVVGRTQGNFNGSGEHTRNVDTLRGVLGLKGDFAALAPNSVVSSWDWDIAGTYSQSQLLARVNDTLLSNLADALAACSATTLNSVGEEVPTTIKQRQEAGCFNPFYSSVINNAAVNPLNVNARTAANARGFITTDSDAPGQPGHGRQDGGYICDPNDPNSPPCPPAFDRNNDGIYELAGTPNTKQVIDHITGQHYELQRRTLATVDGGLRGDLANWDRGGLAFGVGGQFRREGLFIDYDQAYNENDYAFLFGGRDIDPVARNVVAGYAELRLRALDGLIELQPAFRAEIFDTVGVGVNPLLGVGIRPFAALNAPPAALEWLMLRGHVGRGQQAPSLVQLYGQVNEFTQVDYRDNTLFIAHQISGNPDLGFENYMTIGGGLQWDYAGIHLGADFWATSANNVVTADNTRTLVADCWELFQAGAPECTELKHISGTESLDHVESRFENLAEIETNGVDGTLSYTLDTKRRGIGDIGTFFLGVQGSYLNSYLIRGPRVLQPFYRDGAPPRANVGEYLGPTADAGGRDYSNLSAEYEAAGYRNLENFAPPLPKLRLQVPVRWLIGSHTLGATMRYVSGYNDDSEFTVERQNLPGIDMLQFAEGEHIPAWTVFDAMYAFTFDNDGWKTRIAIGVINLLDEDPPAVEGPLGYEVGIHDPRGRMLYARVTGEF
jgi:outer membrane receptor protein involved in Fe transport